MLRLIAEAVPQRPMLPGALTFDRRALRPHREILSTAGQLQAGALTFIRRGVPEHIKSDNGLEFVAKAVQDWVAAVGAKTACIGPRSPLENGYIESFNARLRDELLDGEIFYTLSEVRVVVESWRRFYNSASEHPSVYVIEENRFC